MLLKDWIPARSRTLGIPSMIQSKILSSRIAFYSQEWFCHAHIRAKTWMNIPPSLPERLMQHCFALTKLKHLSQSPNNSSKGDRMCFDLKWKHSLAFPLSRMPPISAVPPSRSHVSFSIWLVLSTLPYLGPLSKEFIMSAIAATLILRSSCNVAPRVRSKIVKFLYQLSSYDDHHTRIQRKHVRESLFIVVI